MAHFVLTRPSGWITAYVPTAADFNSLDGKTFAAVNGDGGGSWAPTAAIVIGGQGLQVTTTLDLPAGATQTVDGGVLSISGAGGGGEIQGINSSTIYWAATYRVWSFQNNAACVWADTATSEWQSGTTCTWDNGSTVLFRNGTNITLDAAVTTTANTAIFGTSAGASWFQTNGSGISIRDATNPTFSTPRSRVVFQPFAPYGLDSSASVGFPAILDGGAGGISYMALTKLINGSVLDQISLVTNVPGAAHTSAVASKVELIKITNAGTYFVLSTQTGPVNVTGNSTVTMSGIGATIDDTQFSYALRITAESSTGAAHIFWYAPSATMNSITTLGQF